MIYTIQAAFAFPIAAAGIGCFIWALMNPGSIGLIRLSLFAFAMQFCIGPILDLFTHNVEITATAGEVATSFYAIYLFFLAVFLVAIVWRRKIDPILVVRSHGSSHEYGIFARLTEASLRAPLLPTLVFYTLVMVIRGYMLVKYGAGLSGTGTLEQTLAMPYWLLAIFKTFHSLGLTFVYVAITKLAYRQRGGFWWILIIVCELLNTFIKGRRRLTSLVLLMFFAVIMKHGKLKLFHAFVAVISVVLLAKIVFPMFYNMRHEWQYEPEAPISRWVSEAWKNTLSGGEYGESQRIYNKSFSDRLSALSEEYELAHILNSGYKPAYGLFLKNGFLAAVPRFLMPNKITNLLYDDDLMDAMYPLGGRDLVSNLPAFGLTDFGVLGGFIYGVVYALALRIIELMMKILFDRTPIGAIALFSSMAFEIVLQVEIPPGSFFITVRLAISIFLLFYLWTSMFGNSSWLEDQPQARVVA